MRSWAVGSQEVTATDYPTDQLTESCGVINVKVAQRDTSLRSVACVESLGETGRLHEALHF